MRKFVIILIFTYCFAQNNINKKFYYDYDKEFDKELYGLTKEEQSKLESGDIIKIEEVLWFHPGIVPRKEWEKINNNLKNRNESFLFNHQNPTYDQLKLFNFLIFNNIPLPFNEISEFTLALQNSSKRRSLFYFLKSKNVSYLYNNEKDFINALAPNSTISTPKLINSKRLIKNDYRRDQLLTQIEKMIELLQNRKYLEGVAFFLPVIVNKYGGKEKMSEFLKKTLEKDGSKIIKTVIGEASNIFEDGDEIVSIIPIDQIIKHGELVDVYNTFYIGISYDNGRNWYFMDGYGIDVEMKYPHLALVTTIPTPKHSLVDDLNKLINEFDINKYEIIDGKIKKKEIKNFKSSELKDCVKELESSKIIMEFGKEIDLFSFCECVHDNLIGIDYSVVNILDFDDINSPLYNEKILPCLKNLEINTSFNEKYESEVLSDNNIESILLINSGVSFRVPLKIGEFHKYFTLDSGASDSFISTKFERILKTKGLIKNIHYLPSIIYEMANGNNVLCKRVLLSNVGIGNFTVNNVVFAIMPEDDVGFLLGKSFLDNFSYWSIVTEQSKLVLVK